jgi:putative transposase
MAWKPSHLTREQMEERRRVGAQLLKTGKLSQAAIAQQLGVSRMAVSQWATQLAQGGMRALRRRPTPGRPGRLGRKDQKALLGKLKRGALAAGFPTERWTMSRVRQLIEREFGVCYHVHSINRLLAQLGWSLQRPLPRATEQDEELVRAWLAQDWPRIKKGAALRRKHRVL